MKEYLPFNDKANDAILAQKVQLGIDQINENLELTYREARCGEEHLEEDLDSDVEVPGKKPRKVVITDDAQHTEELAYEVLVMKRRLFDSIVRQDLPAVKRAEVFKALVME